MKDVAGHLLELGQTVALAPPGYTYSLVLGKIIGFTPKMIKVEYKDNRSIVTTMKFPEQLCWVKNGTTELPS